MKNAGNRVNCSLTLPRVGDILRNVDMPLRNVTARFREVEEGLQLTSEERSENLFVSRVREGGVPPGPISQQIQGGRGSPASRVLCPNTCIKRKESTYE